MSSRERTPQKAVARPTLTIPSPLPAHRLSWLTNSWDAPIWYIKTARVSGTNSIRWDRLLPDGSRFTDPQHGHLLEMARRFLRILMEDPKEMMRIDAHSTALARTYTLLTVIEWMNRRRLARFRDIVPSDWDDYRALVAWGSDALVASAPSRPEKLITSERILEHFRVWKHLRDFHVERLPDGSPLLPDGLAFEPFSSDKDPSNLARQLGAPTDTTKTIPPEIALFAINAAIEWIVYHGKELIKLHQSGEAEFLRERERLNSQKRASEKIIERLVALQIRDWIAAPETAPTYAGKLSRTKLAALIGVSFNVLYKTASHRTLLDAFDNFLVARTRELGDQLSRKCKEILDRRITATDRSDDGHCWLAVKNRMLPYNGAKKTNGGMANQDIWRQSQRV
jgi:hypothetical protein